jgi:hypothetical protein
MSGPSFTLAGRRARAAAITVCAGTLALAAGCSAGTTSGTTSSTAATRTSARTALVLAADEAERVTSMTASFSSEVSGNAAQNFAGTMRAQLKPTLVAEVTANVVASGQPLHLTEILTDKAMYLKLAALAKETGKPWVKIPFSGLSGNGGALFSQLVQSVQNDNPAQQITMASASKNVRVVGTQVIDGVPTTEYAGSYTAAAALAKLSPSQRQTLGPELKDVRGQAHYTEWIDAQHHVRKSVITETVNGEHVTLTFNITAINEPVDIVLPRPRRVALLPSGSL